MSSPRPKIWTSYLPGIALLVGVWGAAQLLDRPFSDLSKDPLSVVKAFPWLGVLSNLGILLWAASASAAGLAASVERNKGWRRLLMLAALLTGMLLFDDLFMVHEQLSGLGLGEKWVFGGYVLLTLVYLGLTMRMLSPLQCVLLWVACGFFAISIVVDALPETWLSEHHLFEDGSKFLAQVGWCGHHLWLARLRLRQG